MRVFIAGLAAVALAGPISAEAHFTGSCKKNPCKHHVVSPFDDKLERIHACEARGVGWFRDGPFDGGLQFHPRTWNTLGSRYSFAYVAPKLEQMYRAVILRMRIGTWVTTAGWPVCGYR